ncbi:MULTISPECIES: cytochrome P450 [unclassified Streptomyces]|uniref:cytochrome P450 n=1 Tax=unclassified Streptomyces TaxID=2593676 RepID=UPI00036132E6|nr:MULTISPECIES: cytochrome P450 [unclassified Streptomyces]MYT29256.1 cytochrome P450 [Streptomyces sp. SID8354]
MVLRELLPRFDPLAPDVLDDPYPAYARLRATAPLCRMGPGSYGVTRHKDVATLLKDRRLGSEFPEAYHRASAGDGAAGAFFRRIVLYRDPPDHTRLRRLLGQAFSPRLVRSLEARIGGLVDRLLEPARDTGRFDAVTDLAFPLPVMVVCELMGLSAADRDLIRPRAVDLGKAFAAVVPEEDRSAADAAVTWLREYLDEVLAERARRPGEDLLSRMLAAEEAGATLSHAEIVDNAVFSFFAGFETTMNLLATGCAALLEHPGELARLRADRSQLPSAVEEFLRYDAPIQGTARLVREPVTVGDRTLRPGRVLVLLLGSANRDGEVFRDPDRLDIGRDPNPQVSFGGGMHHCLGAVLARLEGRVVFGRLLDTFAALEPDGPALRRTDSSFRAYGTVPVAVRPV